MDHVIALPFKPIHIFLQIKIYNSASPASRLYQTSFIKVLSICRYVFEVTFMTAQVLYQFASEYSTCKERFCNSTRFQHYHNPKFQEFHFSE